MHRLTEVPKLSWMTDLLLNLNQTKEHQLGKKEWVLQRHCKIFSYQHNRYKKGKKQAFWTTYKYYFFLPLEFYLKTFLQTLDFLLYLFFLMFLISLDWSSMDFKENFSFKSDSVYLELLNLLIVFSPLLYIKISNSL